MAISPEEILQLHKSYADEFTQLASSGLLSAFAALGQSGLFDYTPTQIAINVPQFGRPNTDIPLPALPDDPKLVDLGALLSMKEIPNLNGNLNPPALPTSLTQVPVYDAPGQPEGGTPALTAAAPAGAVTPTMPPAPSYIPLGSLVLPYGANDIRIPTAPTLTDPVFEGRRPNDIVVPDAGFFVTQYKTDLADQRTRIPAYVRDNVDALMTQYCPEYAALRARINGIILSYTDPDTGGGAGIPAHIETAIYSRATGRNAEEAVTAIETTAKALGKRGHTLPALALQAAVKDALTKMGDANVKASTDLATKNLEMEQQQFQFVLKLGESLEEKILDVITQWSKLALEMDAQALASAKEILAAYLGAYNLQVLVYKALWDGYAVDAQVFRDKIAALDGQVRLYEAEIRAELAKTEINKDYVAVLQAIVGMNRALSEDYKVRLDVAMAPLEVVKINNSIYELRVRAFASEVQGYEARWNAYRAQVDGELGKFKAFSDLAAAYASQVAGYKAQIEGYAAQVDAIAKTNTAIAGRNQATLDVFRVRNNAVIEVFGKQIAGYTAESNVAVQQANIELEYWRTTSNLIFQEFSVVLNQTFEYAREQMNLFRGQMEAAISAANGLAHASSVAGQLAGSAMQGLTSFAGNLVTSEG